jgi:hypothetical protein
VQLASLIVLTLYHVDFLFSLSDVRSPVTAFLSCKGFRMYYLIFIFIYILLTDIPQPVSYVLESLFKKDAGQAGMTKAGITDSRVQAVQE